MRPKNQANQLNTARTRTERADTRTARSATRRHPVALRRLALLLSLCLAWSLALSPCLAAVTAHPAPQTGLALRAALGDHVPAAQRALWGAQSRKVALMQAQLRRFPYRAYAAARTRPQAVPILPPAPAPISLLDRAGHLARPVPAAEVAAWRKELSGRPPAARAARLHLWLGEWALADQRQPDHAAWQFRQALRLTAHADPLRGAAAFDGALALYYADAYADATDAFRALMSPSAPPLGYDRRTCALWGRMASACAGYHAQHSAAGIPEPTRLDPQCGAAALANACRSLGRQYDKGTILRACRVTGEGSSLQDVLDGAKKLGLAAYAVTADDTGLMLLPKPLVAHVERDHFVSVVKADKHGVSYLCSDCGMWPGGRVDLTWKQWHTMNAGNYAAVCLPGSDWDRTLRALLAGPDAHPALIAAVPAPIRVASLRLGGLGTGRVAMLLPALPLLRGHVFAGNVPRRIICGTTGNQPDPPLVCPIPKGHSVDVATGEEQHDPAPDLTVYNPVGPAVTWGRMYQSLRGSGDGVTQGDHTYQMNDFGPGWTQTYDVCVSDPSGGGVGTAYPKSLVMQDGSKIAFTAAAAPTSANPVVHCVSTLPGTPFLLDWDYDGSAFGHYTVTFQDRTKWVTGSLIGGINCFALAQIVDRNGHAITFHFGPAASGCDWPLLASITNEAGTDLLTVQRATDGSGNVVLVSDCYGREVFYHDGTYGNAQVPKPWARSMQLLDRVSQLVPAGTNTTPPDRYVYGYTDLSNGNPSATTPGGYELVPFLTSCSVPSPTGSGVSTITWHYDPATDFMTAETDGNGNVITYAYASNGTAITYADAHGNVAYTEVVGYDNQMNGSSHMNATGQATATSTYADPNDPYKPSSVTDANGHTTSYTWDQFGNETSEMSARGTVTTNTYSYTNFALGELAKVNEGSKTATTYTYYEPSGLTQSIKSPQPNSVGTGVQVENNFTYDNYGNELSETKPGNNTVSSITTTFNYMNDPGDRTHNVNQYNQQVAVDQPLTITDNTGKVSHYRYDSQGNTVATIDALGNEYTRSFNIANQTLNISYPATNQTGTGHAVDTTTYLYPGGFMIGSARYDESGNVSSETNYSYGPEGELLASSGSDETVSYGYDCLYRRSTLTDGDGHTTHFYYNQQGYLDTIVYPGYTGPLPVYNSSTETWSNVSGQDTLRFPAYDADGDVLKRIDGNNVETDYIYNDPQNKLTNIQYPANSDLNVGYQYDAYGRRSVMTDGTGQTSYAYDDADFTLSTTTSYVNGPQNQEMSYLHYPDGDSSKIYTPAGVFSFGYDADGRMTSTTNPYGENFSWGYYDNYLMQTQTLANGAVTTYTRNSLGQIVDLATRTGSGVGLSDFGNIGYSGARNCTSISVSMPAAPSSYSGTTSYSYNAQRELTHEQSSRSGNYQFGFSYDAAENPTSFRGNRNTFSTDNQDTSNGYDGNGNPTTYQRQTVQYDAENRLTIYGSILKCGYSGDGLRTWKQSSADTTYYLYVNSIPVCELNGAGSVIAVNTIGADGLVSRHTSSGSVFYTFDPFGNVAQRLDLSANVLSAAVYDAFGMCVSTTGSTPDVYGYGGEAGYYTDIETGLVLLTHRFYDPSCGRFLTRDPIGYDGGIDLYNYVMNDPNNLRDATGFASEKTRHCSEGPPEEEAGNCSGAEYSRLWAQKCLACSPKKLGGKNGDSKKLSCAGLTCHEDIVKLYETLLDCLDAREAMDAICFECGDEGHEAKRDSLWKKMVECNDEAIQQGYPPLF